MLPPFDMDVEQTDLLADPRRCTLHLVALCKVSHSLKLPE